MFPVNQMVLMLINNKTTEPQVAVDTRSSSKKINQSKKTKATENKKEIDEAEELNQLIQKMSTKLPRSEFDEYESGSQGSGFDSGLKRNSRKYF